MQTSRAGRSRAGRSRAGRAPGATSRRRFLTASATALAGGAVVTAGCTGPGASPGTAGGARSLSPASLETWIWWVDPQESIQQMGANFTNTVPQVTMRVEVPPGYWDKLQTALAGGSGPDIYLMNNVNYRVFANRGILADLTTRLATDSNARDFTKHAWQTGLKFYDFKGKSYGVPVMLTSIVTLYNETAVREAGLTPPAELGEAWTWNRLEEYAVRLTGQDGDAPTWGVHAAQGIEEGWLNYVRANGSDFLSPDASQCVIDQAASAAAWEYLTNLVLKRQVVPPPAALQAEPIQTQFATGKVIFWPAASNRVKALKAAYPNPGFVWNYALVPFSPSTGKSGGTTNVTGWVLNKEGKQLDQSWAMLSHMLTKESQDILARADVLRPARDDSAELYYDPKLTGGPPNRKAALEMFKWTTPLPTHERVSWGEMMAPTGQWQSQIFAGTVSVRDGLRQMAAEVNALFAKA
jgi:multiple sugar transport system substrate-binding protein